MAELWNVYIHSMAKIIECIHSLNQGMECIKD